MYALPVLNQHIPVVLTLHILDINSIPKVLVWTSVRFSCVLRWGAGFSRFLAGAICCVLHKISFKLLIIYLCMYVFNYYRAVRSGKPNYWIKDSEILLLWLEVLVTGEKSVIIWAIHCCFFFPGTSLHYKRRLYNAVTDLKINYA